MAHIQIGKLIYGGTFQYVVLGLVTSSSGIYPLHYQRYHGRVGIISAFLVEYIFRATPVSQMYKIEDGLFLSIIYKVDASVKFITPQ